MSEPRAEIDRAGMWAAIQKTKHWADFIRPSKSQREDAEQIDLTADLALRYLMLLDGSKRSAVKMLTGATEAEIERLGGLLDE